MFNRSHTQNAQTHSQQELVPLTPEVAREIEKQLIKNAEALEKLKIRQNTGRVSSELRRKRSAAPFSSN